MKKTIDKLNKYFKFGRKFKQIDCSQNNEQDFENERFYLKYVAMREYSVIRIEDNKEIFYGHFSQCLEFLLRQYPDKINKSKYMRKRKAS